VLIAAVSALVLPLAVPFAALADGDAANGVGVARVSDITGSVAIQRGDTDAPVAAVLNAPVLGADYVTTGASSHAEVQFDGATMVRLGENVQMRFTTVGTDARDLQLAEGTIEVRTFNGGDNVQVDTPSISVRPEESGAYRITVDREGVTHVVVRDGKAAIVTPTGAQDLANGSTLVASGQAADPQLTFEDSIAYDDFDSYNHDRDERVQSALAQNTYANPAVDGIEDLSEYGHWVNDPTYGQVWAPNDVAANWAPYQNGAWVAEPYYGWTWVAAEPWGWAPYHYGAWYHSPSYGWVWYPPSRAEAAVWRPALVAFVSFGAGVSVGFSSGGIGWVPLAPFEVYHPWYGPHAVAFGGYAAFRGYRNAPFGVVTVSSERFLQGRFDHPEIVRGAALQSASVVNGRLPFQPTAANFRYTNRPVPSSLAVHPSFAQTFAGSRVAIAHAAFQQRSAASRTPSYAQNPAWNRFSGARGTASANGYVSHQPTYATQERSNAQSQRPSYATQERSYSSAERSYAAPQRSYAQPQRSYAQSQQRSYAQPQQQRSYAQPQRSYPQAQQRSYAQPRQAPAARGQAQPRTQHTAQPHGDRH
jgi:hypothetical protein